MAAGRNGGATALATRVALAAAAAAIASCTSVGPFRPSSPHLEGRVIRAEESRGVHVRTLRCVHRLGRGEPGGPEPAALVPVVARKKKAWEASLGGEVAARPHVRARLSGWPSRFLADRDALPRDSDAFLRRVAEDTWRGLAAFTDRHNGLPVDNVGLARGDDGAPQGRVGDYTSGTNVGLYLAAAVAARDLGLIDDAEAETRVARVLDTLAGLATYRGLPFNFYDTTSLERTSNFISFVDVAWLAAGLVTVRTGLPALAEHASTALAALDFSLLYDADAELISHGYWVHERAPSIFHYGVLYAESRLGALLAIGKGDVSPHAWRRMMRVPPPLCSRPGPLVSAVLIDKPGAPAPSGYYEWSDRRYVPSWGGSMFEALMPMLFVDEASASPRGLGPNAAVHAAVQREHARRLGYPVWGMSPSAGVEGVPYGEFGAPMLGARGYPATVITPHASALALAVAPKEAVRNLRRLVELYDVYGDFGFYDAVDPRTGRVSHVYLTLDQGMLFLAVANHLDGGRMRRRFMADPIVAPALPLLDEEFPTR